MCVLRMENGVLVAIRVFFPLGFPLGTVGAVWGLNSWGDLGDLGVRPSPSSILPRFGGVARGRIRRAVETM